MQQMNFQDLLRIFQSIDKSDMGFFTLRDWMEALEEEPAIEAVLGVQHERTVELDLEAERPALNHEQLTLKNAKERRLRIRDREIFFKSLDILGDGEVFRSVEKPTRSRLKRGFQVKMALLACVKWVFCNFNFSPLGCRTFIRENCLNRNKANLSFKSPASKPLFKPDRVIFPLPRYPSVTSSMVS